MNKEELLEIIMDNCETLINRLSDSIPTIDKSKIKIELVPDDHHKINVEFPVCLFSELEQ